MGNVCGCVRAEKEEQYFDPAKSPLSPEKYSPGRKYFRRKPGQKVVGDTELVWQSREREGKKGVSQPARGHPAVSSGELPWEDPAASPTREDAVQLGKTAAAEHSEQRPLPSAVDSCPHRVTDSSAQGRYSEVQVSIPDKTIPEEDSPPYCPETERHLDDVNTKHTTFLRRDDVSLSQTAASSSPIPCVTEKSPQNSALVGNLSKSCSSVPEQDSDERGHPLGAHCLQLTKRRYHSLSAGVSSVSTDTLGDDGCQISDIHVTGESEDMSAKERLLLWTQQATEGYAGVRCENFTTCWRDGKLFNAIIHKYRYGMCAAFSHVNTGHSFMSCMLNSMLLLKRQCVRIREERSR